MVRRGASGVIVLLLLAASLFSAPPKLVIPAEVKPTGEYVRFSPETDGVTVLYVGLSGIDSFPSEELRDGKRFLLPVRGLKPGKYLFAAVAAGEKGEQTRQDFAVIVGVIPVPPAPVPPTPVPPTPTPPKPPPTPPVPVTTGLRVLIVEESAERPKLPATQQSVIFSKTVRDYLNAKCAPGVGSTKAWGIFDKDQDISGYGPQLDALMKRPRQSLPWVAIEGDGKVLHEGPLPVTVEKMMELLKKYGG